MTEQELKDEREQAVKRGGEIYAEHYMEGLLDGRNLALRQNGVLCAVNRNYVSPGDWIETNDGTFAKIEKLDYREVYTDKGMIKKMDIKQVYVLNRV